ARRARGSDPVHQNRQEVLTPLPLYGRRIERVLAAEVLSLSLRQRPLLHHDQLPVAQFVAIRPPENVAFYEQPGIGPADREGYLVISAKIERQQEVAHIVDVRGIISVVAGAIPPSVNQIVPEIKGDVARSGVSAL